MKAECRAHSVYIYTQPALSLSSPPACGSFSAPSEALKDLERTNVSDPRSACGCLLSVSEAKLRRKKNNHKASFLCLLSASTDVQPLLPLIIYIFQPIQRS